jgi:hypothetical protein
MILFDLIPEALSLSLNGTNRLRQSAKRDLTKKMLLSYWFVQILSDILSVTLDIPENCLVK